MVEVPRADEEISRSYIIQPSERQFYRVQDLHECHHYQVRGVDEVLSLVKSMQARGLKLISPSKNTSKESFVTILTNDRNYILPDIVVINQFSEDAIAISDAIPLRPLASRVLSQPACANGSDERNNLRMDIGFCAQSHNDPNVVRGMNAPRFTSQLNNVDGLDTDDSLTATLIRSSISLKKLVDILEEDLSTKWNDFPQGLRSQLFCRRIAERHGVPEESQFVTEGTSFGITGPMPDGDFKILDRHLDTQNGRTKGQNAYWGFSRYLCVQYPGLDHPVWIRVAIGGYGKKCVDDFMRRFKVNKKVLGMILSWMDNNPDVLDVDHRILRFRTRAQFKHIRPRANKSVYYSLFVHGLIKLGKTYGFDKALLFEAVFAMTLSPSPSGWYEGIMGAARTRKGRNLITAFIEYKVDNYGSVSAGQFRRRQVSHGRTMKKWMPFRSCRNMYTSFTPEARGKVIRKLWTRHPRRGGVHGAGALIAQEQMTVLAMGLNTGNSGIVDSVEIGSNTDTATRLESMGVQSPSHRAELLSFVSRNINEEESVVENMTCEVCRDDASSTFKGYDTLARGQSLYEMVLGILMSIDVDGYVERVDPFPWSFDVVEYGGEAIRWWDDSIDFGDINGLFVLTNRESPGK